VLRSILLPAARPGAPRPFMRPPPVARRRDRRRADGMRDARRAPASMGLHARGAGAPGDDSRVPRWVASRRAMPTARSGARPWSVAATAGGRMGARRAEGALFQS
jgi:hypothetical protein